MSTRRTAGAALLLYGVATFVAIVSMNAPGGAYDPAGVTDFVAPGHFALAFAAAYVGCLGALALLPFVLGVRHELGSAGDLAVGLGCAAAAVGVVGWFVTAGVDVAMAEGGSGVTSGVSSQAVYTLTEIGNLVSWCAPALCIGTVAILLSRSGSLPRWLRVFSAVAGVCGILAPLFFPFFVYLVWTVTLGVSLVSARVSSPSPQPAPVSA